MKELYLVTGDDKLYQRLRLLLRGSHHITRLSEPAFDGLCLVDIDGYKGDTKGAITLSRGGACDISLPFSFSELRRIIEGEESKRLLVLIPEGRKCSLGEREIALTEVEWRLLEMLMSREGYISREEIRIGVWNMATDGGVVNVYIHYLRSKLEAEGEKIILSSRKEGYMINPKYR